MKWCMEKQIRGRRTGDKEEAARILNARFKVMAKQRKNMV